MNVTLGGGGGWSERDTVWQGGGEVVHIAYVMLTFHLLTAGVEQFTDNAPTGTTLPGGQHVWPPVITAMDWRVTDAQNKFSVTILTVKV